MDYKKPPGGVATTGMVIGIAGTALGGLALLTGRNTGYSGYGFSGHAPSLFPVAFNGIEHVATEYSTNPKS